MMARGAGRVEAQIEDDVAAFLSRGGRIEKLPPDDGRMIARRCIWVGPDDGGSAARCHNRPGHGRQGLFCKAHANMDVLARKAERARGSSGSDRE